MKRKSIHYWGFAPSPSWHNTIQLKGDVKSLKAGDKVF